MGRKFISRYKKWVPAIIDMKGLKVRWREIHMAKNITKQNQKLLNGHYLVYLSLQNKKNRHLTEKQF
jgi:hypothetical protein